MANDFHLAIVQSRVHWRALNVVCSQFWHLLVRGNFRSLELWMNFFRMNGWDFKCEMWDIYALQKFIYMWNCWSVWERKKLVVPVTKIYLFAIITHRVSLYKSTICVHDVVIAIQQLLDEIEKWDLNNPPIQLKSHRLPTCD